MLSFTYLDRRKLIYMDDIKDIIDEVKARNDIADVISDYLKLTPSGSNYKGLCPFHHEKTPSFSVNTSKQIFKCFGCGAGGDVINFIMRKENLDFMDSVKFLANRAGIEFNTNLDEKTKQRLAKIKRYQEMHTEAARYFYSQLDNPNNPALKYFLKRGLDVKTIKRFGLGYSPDSWDSLKNYLVSKGYSLEELFDAGLVSQNKNKTNYYDKFRNRVMFPIFDYKGNVIGFGGRVLDDSLPKYLNSPDSELFNKRNNLYGLNYARKSIGHDKTLILVEGYMDLISLHQFGIKNVVATLGTALTDNQAVLLKRFADNMILSYDSDDAGVNASLRAIGILEKQGIKPKVLNLGSYKDPDEFVRANGMNAMLDRIDTAIEANQFRLDSLRKSYNMDDKKDVIAYIKESSKIVKRIKSPIEKDYYIEYLSSITGTNSDIIRSEFGMTFRNYPRRDDKKPANTFLHRPQKVSVVEDGSKFIELNLIRAMLDSRLVRDTVPLKISLEDFSDENSKKIYEKVSNVDNKGIKVSKDGSIKLEDVYSDDIDIDYIKKLGRVKLNVKFNDLNEVDKIINSFMRESSEKRLEELFKQQEILENRRKTIKNNSQEAKEVDLEIMEIALKIVAENKTLKKF